MKVKWVYVFESIKQKPLLDEFWCERYASNWPIKIFSNKIRPTIRSTTANGFSVIICWTNWLKRWTHQQNVNEFSSYLSLCHLRIHFPQFTRIEFILIKCIWRWKRDKRSKEHRWFYLINVITTNKYN